MATSRGSDQTKYKSAKSSKISRTYIFQFAQDHLNQQKFNRNFESFYKISLGKQNKDQSSDKVKNFEYLRLFIYYMNQVRKEKQKENWAKYNKKSALLIN